MNQNQNPYEQRQPDSLNNQYNTNAQQGNTYNQNDAPFAPTVQLEPQEQQRYQQNSVSFELPQESPYQQYYSAPAKKKLNPLVIVIPAAVIVIALIIALIIILSGSDSDSSSNSGGESGGDISSSEPPAENGSESGSTAPVSSVPETITIAGTTYRTDMTGTLDLTGLGLSDSDINDLKYMTKLSEIILSDNNLASPTVLGELTNLEKLTLHNNSLLSIDFVSNLTELEVFGAGNNAISDLSPLANLRNLKELWMQDNNIKDVSPLKNLMKLEYASFENNFISDFTPLAGNRFRDLYLHRQNGAVRGNFDTIKGLTIYDNLYIIEDNGFDDPYALIDYINQYVYSDSDGFMVY